MRKKLGFLALLALTSCDSTPDSETASLPLIPSQQDIAFAEQVLPSNSELREIYDRSCRLCHAVHGMEAPLTGHTADWDARIKERGFSGLMESAKSGRELMPAMGQCLDCSDEQLTALINFMRDGEKQ